MTTTTIERALLRDLYDSMDDYYSETQAGRDLRAAAEAALAAPATAPDQPSWQDAPTCAGVWMCHMNGEAYQWPNKTLMLRARAGSDPSRRTTNEPGLPGNG